ncbi:MAG TPA: phosphatase PAP2 family protein [Methylomirabilota bacterium]|jgi:membrane-associated phospholipid phosphatase|nr:phosphatase PAP2 family protein [Methylomirabilota bacterium]
MKAHAHRWRGLSIGGAALFVGLGVLVFVVGLLPGDSSLYDEVMARRTPDIITFFTWVNVFGSWKGLLPAAVLLFAISPEARKRWWLVVIVLLAAPIVEQTAKYLVGRPRPRGKAFGFPSGHMTGAASFAVIAIYFAIKERWNRATRMALTAVVLVMVFLVGLARLVLHAHWPSDVLGGLLLGSSCAAFGAWWDARRSLV